MINIIITLIENLIKFYKKKVEKMEKENEKVKIVSVFTILKLRSVCTLLYNIMNLIITIVLQY